MPRIEISSSRILALSLLVMAIGLLGLPSQSSASRYFKTGAAISAQSSISQPPPLPSRALTALFKEERPSWTLLSSLSSRSIWNPLLTGLQAQACSAQGFAAARQFVVGISPYGMAVGDFNGDQRPDLATASLDGNVVVLLGNSSGGFDAATNFVLENPANAVAIGDFNGDGKADLAVTISDFFIVSSNAVIVLLGDGSGGFSAPTTLALAGFPTSIATDDFNRDGKADLAVAVYQNFDGAGINGVSVLLGNGLGGFGALANFPAGSIPRAVVVGDFNGDAKADLAVANQLSNNVSVLFGDGAGGFAAPTNYSVAGMTKSVAIGDFNGDGKPDLAAAAGTQVSVLLNNGSGNFGMAANFAVNLDDIDSNAIAVGDFNRDQKLDLAVTLSGLTDGVVVLAGNGAGSFGVPARFAAGRNPFSLAVSDFNRDGKSDLAVGNVDLGPSTVSILLGNGTGSFIGAPSYAGGGSVAVLVGDFNHDDKLDLASVKDDFGGSQVSVVFGDGAGNFGAAVQSNLPGLPDAAVLGDFNRDGHLDLVTAHNNPFSLSHAIFLLLGDGMGGFGAVRHFIEADWPSSLAAGDFNGDGKLDLAVGNAPQALDSFPPSSTTPSSQTPSSEDPSVAILLGNGAGGFSAPTYIALGPSPRSIAVGDFNGDGKPDLAVVITNFFSFDNFVSVLLNNGSGGFNLAGTYPAGSFPRAVAVGDFNGDGKLDLAVTDTADNKHSVGVLLGNGSGGFGALTSFAVGALPYSISAGDFNGDGKLDLATANLEGQSVSMLPGDGAGGFGAALYFLTDNPPAAIASGDFNRDGKLDLATSNLPRGVSVLLNGCPAPPLNAAPTINVASGLAVQQGSALTRAIIAEVSDDLTPAGELRVAQLISLEPGEEASGISISNVINTNGVITAKVEASCEARSGKVRLIVEDGGGLETTAELSVTVLDDPPALGTYSTSSVVLGQTITVPEINAPPSDGTNRHIMVSIHGFGGSVSVDQTTGAITFTDARPVGSYFVTVTADSAGNCPVVRSFSLIVSKAETNTLITSDTPDPSVVGQAVTVSFRVATTSTTSGTPSGNVTVSDGINSCTGTIAAGNCTLTLTTVGARTLTATYAGDQNFNSSASPGALHQVNQAPSLVTLTSSANPSNQGDPVTLTATVTPAAATGFVRFFDGATFLGLNFLNNGQARLTTSALSVGTQPIMAVYDGDALYAASISLPLIQTVIQPQTDYTIFTVAGNGNYGLASTIGPATESAFKEIAVVAKFSNGDLLIVDAINRTVRRVNAQGLISPFAGNGTSGNGGDGGLAIHASFGRIGGVATDTAGNVYLTDTDFNRIRIVTPDGKIAHFAGDKNGASGSGGEGVQAAQARLRKPTRLATGANSLYVADSGNHLVRQINLVTKIITTIAGNNLGFYNGDNLPATSASLNNPTGVAVDAPGNVYIADTFNQRIRKVAAGSGIITTIAGNGTAGFNGDGIPATSASVNTPLGIAADAASNVYIADQFNHRLRLVSAATGKISTITGNGEFAFFGDNGPAALAQIAYPSDVCLIKDTGRALFLADSGNRRVRKLDRDVQPNHSPVARANLLPTIITASDNNGATVDLDGSASTDADGDVLSFIWMDGDKVIATAATARVKLKIGMHSIVLKVLDERGGESLSTPQTVTVLSASSVTIDQILPGSGNRGSQVQITVIGNGFTPQSKVTISGFGLTIFTTYVSGNKLTIKVTISPNTTDVIRNVTVSNPDGSSATKVNGFTIR